MIDGMAQSFDNTSRRLSVTRFDDFAFDLDGLVEGIVRGKRNPSELPTQMLFAASPATQEMTGTSRARLIAEGHERISNALNGFVAPLIGFAALLVGGFSRFGIWRQIIGAILALIVVQMLTQAGQGAVRNDPDVWPLAYAGPVIGFALAMLLLLVADRPTLFRWRRRRIR